MFHNSDDLGKALHRERRDWMSLLSRAPIDLLESTMSVHASDEQQWLRAPETGLMMVQARVGGTGERFNLGEITVTRCAVRLGDNAAEQSRVGVAYVTGRSHRRAQLAALADAMLQNDAQRGMLEITLLTPTREHLARARAERYTRAQSTRVEFFTVAREANGTDNVEADDQ
jgi:alpha-D-ribose 1-methylphosphonate 5-triphosphate synthase subunit PhnG